VVSNVTQNPIINLLGSRLYNINFLLLIFCIFLLCMVKLPRGCENIPKKEPLMLCVCFFRSGGDVE
jgi:hypothetical protein